MDPWIDPRDTDRAAWGGMAEESPAPTVYERAHDAALPYERYESVALAGPDVREAFESAAYDHAKLRYHIVVDSGGRVRLLSKGHLWGEAEETHQRFRIQYRRPPEPTDAPPFDEYTAWVRFRTGTVSRGADGLTFEPDPEQTRERTLTLPWPEMYATDQLRVAEAELVRNPPLARYVLSEQDLWADVRDALKYNPDAFADGA